MDGLGTGFEMVKPCAHAIADGWLKWGSPLYLPDAKIITYFCRRESIEGGILLLWNIVLFCNLLLERFLHISNAWNLGASLLWWLSPHSWTSHHVRSTDRP
jgi:hypothetical protein